MDAATANYIIASTPLLRDVDRVDSLHEGFSEDRKYVLWQGGRPRYVLRLSDAQYLARRRIEFDIIAMLHQGGIRCPQPYLFGETDDGSCCYSVLEYIEGDDGRKALVRLSEAQQYALGFEAGMELRRIHRFRHPEQRDDWFTRRKEKYLRQMREFLDAGLDFAYRARVECYIEAGLDALREYPAGFQHDDYHPSNLVIRDGRLAGVIDFNRCDWGDQVEDFIRMAWFTTGESLHFARGQVDGYRQDRQVESFWLRYNLFVAMSLPPALLWTHRLFPDTMDLWRSKAVEIVETHDFENSGPPVWYTQDVHLIDLNKKEKDR